MDGAQCGFCRRVTLLRLKLESQFEFEAMELVSTKNYDVDVAWLSVLVGPFCPHMRKNRGETRHGEFLSNYEVQIGRSFGAKFTGAVLVLDL